MTDTTINEPFDHEAGPRPPLADAIEDALPQVARSGERANVLVIILAGVILGLLVLVFLSEQRAGLQQAQLPAPRAQTRAPAAAPITPPVQPPAPSLAVAPAVPVVAPPPPQTIPAPTRASAEAATDVAQTARWKSPSLILDLSTAGNASNAAANAPAAGVSTAAGAAGAAPAAGTVPALTAPITQALTPPAARPVENLTQDERFAQRLGVDDTQATIVKATRIQNPSTTMPQGSVISGVLETAINSDLPGFARAVVTREVRSFDGTTLLVPRGSHIIGQYRSGIALGQSRVFVVWTRLIRPDGVSVELASAGTDDLGRGGLEGDVDRHFLERFGGAMLLSLMGIGGQAVSPANTQVVINSTQAGASAAGVALQQEISISPTIEVPPGTPLRIFVARDLDFSAVESGH